MPKCDFCNKQCTRFYDGHSLCEFHYLKQNPRRNALKVLWGMRDNPPWKIKDRMELLAKLRKAVSLKEIEDCLEYSSWYQRLKG